MIIYFGGCNSPYVIHALGETDAKRILISFTGKHSKNSWMLYRQYGFEIAADSGAFTAWQSGKPCDIHQYMQWLNKHDIKTYFNMDVVGDVNETEKNQTIMENEGFKPVPVFHYGSDFSELNRLVDKYDLVGLGGTVGRSFNTKVKWFQRIFTEHPTGRFHAFGTTNEKLICQFPFFSCDSTWWLYKFWDENQKMFSNSKCPRKERIARVKYLLSLEDVFTGFQPVIF